MDALTWLSLSPLKAEIFLSVSGMLLLMLGAFRGASSVHFIMTAVLGAFVGAMLLVCKTDLSVTDTINGMVMVDGFASWFKLLILGGLFVSLFLASSWLNDNQMLKFEYPLLVLFSGLS